RIELYLESAQVYERELNEAAQAIDCLLNVVAIEENNKTALAVLPRLYTATEQYERAVDSLVRHATLDGTDHQKAALYAEAGRLAFEHLMDAEVAQRHLEQAIALDAENFAALRLLGTLHAKRGNAQQAIELTLRAEAASSHRSERIALLYEAAQLADAKLG